MVGTAAYKKCVEVATALPSGAEITDADDSGNNWFKLPATSPSLNIGNEMLDDTVVCEDGFRSRIEGLTDWSCAADSNYSNQASSEAKAALDIVRNAFFAKNSIAVRYLPLGPVVGQPIFYGNVRVESFNFSGDVGALETVAISLQADGALTGDDLT